MSVTLLDEAPLIYGVDNQKPEVDFEHMAFEWDAAKESANMTQHGVDFSTVPVAFDDPRRLILPDASHSGSEARFYCIGSDGRGILTVRFTLRGDNIRAIGVGYWRKQQQVYEKTNH